MSKSYYDPFKPTEMFKLIGDNSREFWQGFTATGITGGTILFTSNIFLDSITKIFVAGLIACVGGLGAALASDIYKHFIQKIVSG